MWELVYKESWVLKNWCFWTVVLERTLEVPLDCKEIQPVHPKGDQSWAFIGRTDAEAEIPILRSPDAKNWLIWKDPDAGKDWGQEEKVMTEDEMFGWHYWLNGHEFGWTLAVGDGQGLACCSPWGHKESDTTERLNWNELKGTFILTSGNRLWGFTCTYFWINCSVLFQRGRPLTPSSIIWRSQGLPTVLAWALWVSTTECYLKISFFHQNWSLNLLLINVKTSYF